MARLRPLHLLSASLALCAALPGASVSLAAAPAAAAAPSAPLGTPPPADALPKPEFAFEARVTLLPANVVGQTVSGHRQYIPITGGTVTGPSFKGEVVPGGWDYQLRNESGCTSLTADYFWRAQDGTLIHVLNQGLLCPPTATGGVRTWLRPQFEAPKGPHEWMTHAHFVATLEPDRPATPAAAGAPAPAPAIRIKFYQLK